MKHWPFNVVQKEGDKPYIEVVHLGERKTFSPEDILSMVFKKMKSIEDKRIKEKFQLHNIKTQYGNAYFNFHSNFNAPACVSLVSFQTIQLRGWLLLFFF
jgi:hypothetical protein